MAYIVRVYYGNLQADAELSDSDRSDVSGLFQNTDAFEILRRKGIAFARTSSAWRFTTNEPIMLKNQPVSAGTIHSGDFLLIDRAERLALTVFPSQPRCEKVVSLEGIERLQVGRAATAELSVAGRCVSEAHAALYRENSLWHIRDLGSANGTYVNGRMVTQYTLKDGDVIDISLCRLILSNATLVIRSQESVTLNLPGTEEKHCSASSADAPYPHAFKRSPRLKHELPSGEIEIQTPPAIGAAPSVNWLTILLPPIAMACIMIAMVLLTSRAATTLLYTVPMTLVSLVVSVVNYRSQRSKHAQISGLRESKYQDYLARVSEEIEKRQVEQRDRMAQASPSTEDCLKTVDAVGRSLWDRKPDDADFMTLRLGSGNAPFCVPIKTQKQPLSLEEDPLLCQPAKIAEKYQLVPQCPITVDLLRSPTLGVIGTHAVATGLAQMLVLHATTRHCYNEMKIILICREKDFASWSFVRWLPHSFDESRRERYIACTPTAAAKLLGEFEDVLAQRAREVQDERGQSLMKLPYLLFLCADAETVQKHGIMRYLKMNEPTLGVGAVFLTDQLSRLPKECSAIVEADEEHGVLYHRERSDDRQEFSPDSLDKEQLDRFARAMAPIRAEESAGGGQFPASISFLQGYCVKRPQEISFAANWENNLPNHSMAVPIGVRQNGETFYFDIHEKASGPHGLVAGMTGSGKSEMVQSWILSMALRFSPQAVSFILRQHRTEKRVQKVAPSGKI